MAKKCIPGVFCIENMTLFILCIVVLMSFFLFFTIFHDSKENIRVQQTKLREIYQEPSVNVLAIKNDVFTDPYFPPLKDNIGIVDYRRGVPINIETQRRGTSHFNQIGILTRTGNINGELILPIFGRNLIANRDKWQYYTLSNTGNISSKLPIRVNGKDAMSEYGVDEIYNGDVVYVQGYNDIFLATVYDSRGLAYLPYL